MSDTNNNTDFQKQYFDINICFNYENNPRQIQDEKFKKLKDWIIKDPNFMLIKTPFGYKEVLKDGSFRIVILGGNQRLKACKDLGWDKFPVVICKDLFDTDGIFNEKLAKDRCALDNIEFGEYDYDILANTWEIQDLEDFKGLDWGLDKVFEFEITDKNETDEESQLNNREEKFSQNIGKVLYEPKKTYHKIEELYTLEEKFKSDIDNIENKDLQEFFKARVSSFTSWNYSKIADYYAYQASQEEQKLFEKLALVLLDKDKLIENGFSKLLEDSKAIFNNEYEQEQD